ncbi:hypothetical protein LCGC14_1277340 [marine sediment metagenome]|uniref:Uncharacterized protein n=1 Tax=marine sediment metagenome TaxID=412755 RepID=A0A0F9NZB1_9ZZZZ
MVLIVPSGACRNRPLLDFEALRRGRRNDRSNSAFPFPALQAQTVPVQQSQGPFTVTPTGDNFALRAIRGQMRNMRIGRQPSGTRLAKSHTGVPKSEANWLTSVGLVVPPDPRKLKTILLFERIAIADNRARI